MPKDLNINNLLVVPRQEKKKKKEKKKEKRLTEFFFSSSHESHSRGSARCTILLQFSYSPLEVWYVLCLVLWCVVKTPRAADAPVCRGERNNFVPPLLRKYSEKSLFLTCATSQSSSRQSLIPCNYVNGFIFSTRNGNKRSYSSWGSRAIHNVAVSVWSVPVGCWWDCGLIISHQQDLRFLALTRCEQKLPVFSWRLLSLGPNSRYKTAVGLKTKISV